MYWIEPEGCTTPRGWLYADAGEHPIDGDDTASSVARAETSRAVGNYLYYDNADGRGEGAFHICAYMTPRYGASAIHADIPSNDRWHATREAAKAAVARHAARLLGADTQGALL